MPAQVLETKPKTEDEVLDEVIDRIWSNYDKDGNGHLDSQEVKLYITDMIE